MVFDILNKRKAFNERIYNDTVKYQKKYGFEIGEGEHATWNNEADAFKHAYMQAVLSIEHNDFISKAIGDYHESETPNAPKGERNMDLWNNAIGREIVRDMKKDFKATWDNLTEENKRDIAAQRIVEKMRQGELITNPADPRTFDNMKYERLKPEDKVLYKGEYFSLPEKEQDFYSKLFAKQLVGNDWKIPDKKELDKQVQSGDLIYVDYYTKADGTNVSGYYRHKPGR